MLQVSRVGRWRGVSDAADYPEANTLDVLIWHPDGSLTRSLETFLMGCGYTVEVADTGPAAIRKLLSDTWGLIVLGVQIDDDEGFEMIPLIHQIDRELPVVAVGNEGSLEMERKVRLEQVFYYMVQPVDFGEMKEVACRALQGRRHGGKRHD